MKQHLMFDIDGTLIHSYEFDEKCFLDAIHQVTGIELTPNWEVYPHVTDKGILQTFIEHQAPHIKCDELEPLVKASFIDKIKDALSENAAQPVKGAVDFINKLNEQDDIKVSFATGGWLETALLKLESAGFDTQNINIASANDHHSRTEIMKIASLKVNGFSCLDFTYFGDASWDVRACNDLGVNLVIVGDRVKYHQKIENYLNPNEIFSFVNGA